MQNTFSQSGNDSKWFPKKSFFRISMWNSRPPPPSWKKTILNFHFDYRNPSLAAIKGNCHVIFVYRIFRMHIFIYPYRRDLQAQQVPAAQHFFNTRPDAIQFGQTRWLCLQPMNSILCNTLITSVCSSNVSTVPVLQSKPSPWSVP